MGLSILFSCPCHCASVLEPSTSFAFGIDRDLAFWFYHHWRFIDVDLVPKGFQNEWYRCSFLKLRRAIVLLTGVPTEAGKHEQFEDDQNDLREPQFKQPKQFMSWNWNRKAGSTTPTIIPLCYVTKNTHDLLDKYFKLAIQEWHDVLGAKRGVEFRLYQVDEHNVCATPINAGSDADSDDSYVYADKCWDNNHVQIRWSSPKMDRGTYTTVVGFNWGGEAADMFIETHPYLSDASGYSGSDEVITANVVHELGNIPQTMARDIDLTNTMYRTYIRLTPRTSAPTSPKRNRLRLRTTLRLRGGHGPTR